MLAITHARVLTPSQIIDRATVVVGDDGKIEAINPPHLRSRCQVIRAQGFTLIPGLIDLQLNGAFGHDFTADPHTIWPVAAQLPRFGVTSFLPTIVTAPLARIAQAQTVLADGAPSIEPMSQPLGLHLEGPFLNPEKRGAHNPSYLQLPTEPIDWSPKNSVRLVTLAPELPHTCGLIEQLTARGVVVSAGHSLATYEQGVTAFEQGVRYGTHLFNTMPSLHHRDPGLVGALLDAPEVVVGIIPDGWHVHPSMVRLAWQLKGPHGLNLVSDGMAALGQPAGQYPLNDMMVQVDGETARLADGRLAGSILPPDQAIRNLMQWTGCSLPEAVMTMTRTPADLLGLTQKGRIAVGCDADLVLLDDAHQVHMTLTKGRVAYERATQVAI